MRALAVRPQALFFLLVSFVLAAESLALASRGTGTFEASKAGASYSLGYQLS